MKNSKPSPFRFVHVADVHLDSPFAGLHAISPKVAQRLRESTFQAFDRVVGLCVESRADFLLVAGDVYDSQDRSLRAQLRFRDGLRRLTDKGIPSFVVHGNHDPLDCWSASLHWPEGVHIFGPSPARVPVVRDGKTLAHVYGISYPTKEVRHNLAQLFRRSSEDAFAIGLLHCNVGSDTGHEPYAPCSLDDLVAAGMDYWALGHVHVHGILHPQDPTVVYAGNPQGRNPRELGPRGCYLVDVAEDGRVAPRFVAVDAVRWSWETLSLEKIDDMEGLVRELETLVDHVLDNAEGRNAVCRITLVGRSPIHASLSRPGVIPDLEQHLRDGFGGRDPFAWVEHLDVATRPPVDVESRRSAGDFLGDLLQLVSEYRSDSAKLNTLQQELNALFGTPRARRSLLSLTNHDLRAWLDAAEVRCLDLLLGEEE